MVLDVNYFPSYKELRTELPGLLRDHFTALVAAAKANAAEDKAVPNAHVEEGDCKSSKT